MSTEQSLNWREPYLEYMDANFIEIVDNIYEHTFIDRIFLNEANHISEDQFLDAIAGSLGDLLGGAFDDMFHDDDDADCSR